MGACTSSTTCVYDKAIVDVKPSCPSLSGMINEQNQAVQLWALGGPNPNDAVSTSLDSRVLLDLLNKADIITHNLPSLAHALLEA